MKKLNHTVVPHFKHYMHIVKIMLILVKFKMYEESDTTTERWQCQLKLSVRPPSTFTSEHLFNTNECSCLTEGMY